MIQLWFLVSFQLVALVLVLGFLFGSLVFSSSFFTGFLLVLFSVGSISRLEFVFHDRLRMQQPAWRVVVSSVSYREHVET